MYAARSDSYSTVVIMGQGYVGLPLAVSAAEAGHRVIGLELKQEVVDNLNSGHSHVDDIDDSDIEKLLESGYRASVEPAVIAEANVVVICVPTPLSPDGGPDLSAVRGATQMVCEHMREGTLVVLESTTYPGTTEEVLLPILEMKGRIHGAGFWLAFSPERVDPGNPTYGIRNTPKLVGGVDDNASRRAAEFYSTFVDSVVVLSGTREAEMAKLLENTYRHVNIALVNEMAKFCHEMSVDIWEVIRGAATKPFGFQAFLPGPGVGGHCIPIDPNYLSHEVRKQLGYPFRFVELAQEINASMPRYVVHRVMEMLNSRGRSLRGAKVLLLGVTYKPDIADQRESPAVKLAEELSARGATVSYCDPHVPSWQVHGSVPIPLSELDMALKSSDISVLVQAHSAFDRSLIVASAQSVLDCRGVLEGVNIERL